MRHLYLIRQRADLGIILEGDPDDKFDPSAMAARLQGDIDADPERFAGLVSRTSVPPFTVAGVVSFPQEVLEDPPA